MTIQAHIADTMRQVYHRGLTTLSGGNLSVRDGQNLWITPSGIDKGQLQAEDIIYLKQGGAYDGTQRPSSEYPFHQAIYSVCEDIKVILHAHVPALVAYCIAHKTPNTRLLKDAYAICGDIGYTDYVMPGSPQLGEALAEKFAEGYSVVLMENHGVITVGQTLEEAFSRLELSALIAQASLHATKIGQSISLENLPEAYQRQPNNLTQQTDLADKISEFRQRGIQQHLLNSTTTHVYAKADNQTLFSQHQEHYQLIEGIHPYLQGDNYCISAQTPHLMSFAITHTQLDTRTIPEAYTTLHDMPLVEDDDNAIIRALKDYPAIIVKNRGVIIRAKTLLIAYDRLEVLEYTARSAIEAQAIGGVVPMSEQAIQDLDQHYHQYYKGLKG